MTTGMQSVQRVKLWYIPQIVLDGRYWKNHPLTSSSTDCVTLNLLPYFRRNCISAVARKHFLRLNNIKLKHTLKDFFYVIGSHIDSKGHLHLCQDYIILQWVWAASLTLFDFIFEPTPDLFWHSPLICSLAFFLAQALSERKHRFCTALYWTNKPCAHSTPQ